MDYTSKFTACFNHTLENGKNFTKCTRCHLVVDADGYPDPEYYPYASYVSLIRVRRLGLPCVHQKPHATVLGAPYELPTTIFIGHTAEEIPTLEDGRLYRFEMAPDNVDRFTEGLARHGRGSGSYVASGIVYLRLKLKIRKHIKSRS